MDMIPIEKIAFSDRQDLYSMAFVQAIVATAGFNLSHLMLDRKSIDTSIEIPDNNPDFVKFDRLGIQVKCTYDHQILEDGNIHFPLPVKNYNDLRVSYTPKILIVVLVPRPVNATDVPWIECINNHTEFRNKAYWHSLHGYPETNNQQSVTVKVPAVNLFDVDAVHYLIKRMLIQGIR